jgi:hypothetical protein
MSAFKQFLSTDVIVAPLVVNKSFSFVGSASFINNIERLLGVNINPTSSQPASIQITSSISASQLYNSIKQLYYTNYIPNPISGSPYVTTFNNQVVTDGSQTNVYSRFYNYEQTSLFQTNSINYTSNYGFERYFPTESNAQIGVISISKNIFGDYINPNSFIYKYNIGSDITLYDNGEGLIYKSGSTDYCGIINYSHGLIILTSGSLTTNFTASNDVTCSFQSSRTIYETQYKCTIRPEEFNFSLNPSLISGSTDGTVYGFVTSSYFSPYVTTVGFYNEAQELLMVAKLSQPLPTSPTTDTTILVNIDK